MTLEDGADAVEEDEAEPDVELRPAEPIDVADVELAALCPFAATSAVVELNLPVMPVTSNLAEKAWYGA